MFTLLCRYCHCELIIEQIPNSLQINCHSCSQGNKLEAESYYLPRLMAIQGIEKGKEYSVGDAITIGRDPSNRVQLKDGKVSREHARLSFQDERYILEDLSCVGKTGNGTFLNGQKVDLSPLQDKDIIRIAENVFMFRNPYNYVPAAGQQQELHLPGEIMADDDKPQLINEPTIAEMAAVKRSETHRISPISKAVLSELQSGFERTRAELKFDAQRSFLMSAQELRSSAELENVNAKLRILYEVNNAISSILDLQELMGTILEVVFRYIRAERGAILLYDADTDNFQTSVTKVRNRMEDAPIKISKTMMTRAVKEQVSLLTTDTLLDQEFAAAQSIITEGIRSAMTVPLISKDNLLGVLHIDTTQKSSEFNPDSLELLTGIASQAAIAIENAKLIKKIEKEVETRGHLQRYLSSELVEQIVSNNINLKIGGQLQKATIIFTDLRGFTKLTENIGAEAVVTILNDYFARMVDIIFANNGTLDKFIGDAIMGVWGIPIGHPLDAIRSLRASLQMQRELFFFNIYERKKGSTILKMGAAINTGDVVVGNMGSPKRMEYTVIGPPVNLSSRVESITGRNHILITEHTYREVRDQVECVEMPQVPFKGIERPIKVYGIISLKDETDTLHLFLPVVVKFQGDEASYEGMLEIYRPADKTALLYVEPVEKLQPGTAINLSLDIPNVTPPDVFQVVCRQREVAMHGEDQYLQVETAVTAIPEVVQKFLENIFR